MTGVITSNRCGTCRDRKVKCDEIKPVCGPCQKGGRICKDPISKLKFARPKGVVVVTMMSDMDDPIQSPGEDVAQSQLSILRSIPTRGGSFQTMRVGRPRRARMHAKDSTSLVQHPSMSDTEKLQVMLARSFHINEPGLRLNLFADYMGEIPVMLGQSEAFDDAIACLLRAHQMIVRGQKPATDSKQANLYAKSLLSLQSALANPKECYTDLTLGSVSILGQVEVFGGGLKGPNFIQHAGGASGLVEMRGPDYSHSKFGKMLCMSQRGWSIAVAIMRQEECFFNRPEWRQVSYVDAYNCEIDAHVDELKRAMAALPALLLKIRAFYKGPTEKACEIVHTLAVQLSRSFAQVSSYTDKALHNGIDIIEVPSAHGDILVPTVFHFSTRKLASVCTNYWGIRLVIDTIVARFLPPHTSVEEIHTLRQRCLLARHHILMSYEYTDQFRPLGSMYLSSPLIMAYSGAIAEEKTWIMHRLWRIGELFAEPKVVWAPTNLEWLSRTFLGESYQREAEVEEAFSYDLSGKQPAIQTRGLEDGRSDEAAMESTAD